MTITFVDNEFKTDRALPACMKECLRCHSPSWTSSHFTRLDRVVSEYNQAYYLPLAKKLDALYRTGVLESSRLVGETLEVQADEFWRREGRRTKMGAAMMAPDFTWWHGFYELKKRYTSIMADVEPQN